MLAPYVMYIVIVIFWCRETSMIAFKHHKADEKVEGQGKVGIIFSGVSPPPPPVLFTSSPERIMNMVQFCCFCFVFVLH